MAEISTSVPSSDYKPTLQQMYAERIYRLTGEQVDVNQVTIDPAEIVRIKAGHELGTIQDLQMAAITTKIQLVSLQADIPSIEQFNVKDVGKTIDHNYEKVDSGFNELTDMHATTVNIAEEAQQLSEDHIRGLPVDKQTVEKFKQVMKELREKQQSIANTLSKASKTVDSYSQYRDRAPDIGKPAIPDIEQEARSLPSPAA